MSVFDCGAVVDIEAGEPWHPPGGGYSRDQTEQIALAAYKLGLLRGAEIARKPGALSLAPVGGAITWTPGLEDGVKIACEGIAAAIEAEANESQPKEF